MKRSARAFYLVVLGVGLGCATKSEADPVTEAPVQAAAVAPPQNIRAGEAKLVDHAMAALSAHGSECGYLPEEPGVAVCDRDKTGQVTIVLLWQDPRLFVISHILKADGVDCKDAAPKLNEVNASFDNLTVICADNITFRTMITLGESGLSDDELFVYVDEYRKEVQSILRARALAGVVKE